MNDASEPPAGEHRGLRVLVGLASFAVVVAGLKAAAPILVPVLLALFFSLLCVPPMRRLERLGVPTALAIALVILGATLLVLLLSAVIGRSLDQLQDVLDLYRARLDDLVRAVFAWLAARGIDVDPDQLTEQIDSGAIMGFVGDTASALLSALSNLVLVVLTMIFMLLEAAGLPGKLRRAIGDPDADLSDYAQAAERVQKYLSIKAWVSLLTGVLVSLLCVAAEVDFPLLWGLIAFLFNFIPNIGSIIAAVPAVLLTLLQHGPTHAAIVGAGYFAINMIIGNGLEPRLLGRRLGLSTLVVFVSMLFWNWVWGPVGMLLSVPLTVIVKIIFEHSDDFRWLAVLLGPDEDPVVLAPLAPEPPRDGPATVSDDIIV